MESYTMPNMGVEKPLSFELEHTAEKMKKTIKAENEAQMQ